VGEKLLDEFYDEEFLNEKFEDFAGEKTADKKCGSKN
jgi:hypothetical protein